MIQNYLLPYELKRLVISEGFDPTVQDTDVMTKIVIVVSLLTELTNRQQYHQYRRDGLLTFLYNVHADNLGWQIYALSSMKITCKSDSAYHSMTPYV